MFLYDRREIDAARKSLASGSSESAPSTGGVFDPAPSSTFWPTKEQLKSIGGESLHSLSQPLRDTPDEPFGLLRALDGELPERAAWLQPGYRPPSQGAAAAGPAAPTRGVPPITLDRRGLAKAALVRQPVARRVQGTLVQAGRARPRRSCRGLRLRCSTPCALDLQGLWGGTGWPKWRPECSASV